MSLMTTVTMKRAVRRRRGKGGNLWQMKLWRAFLLTLWPLLGNKPVVALAQENEAKVKAKKGKGKGKGRGKFRQEQAGHATYSDHSAKVEPQEGPSVKRESEAGSAASAQPLPPPPPPPPSPARGGTHTGRGCSRSRSPSRHVQSNGSKVKRESDRFQPEAGDSRVAHSSDRA